MSELGIDKYEIEAWITQLGSMPVKRLLHEDYSRSYEMDEAHVFQLENGKFALVIESGCSCYTPENADIDLFPDFLSAEKKFNEWVSEQKKYERY